MKKPWQIWTVFALCLLVAIPAMVWLSLQALELDRVRENDRLQTELARREAELQERISSSLWRMEWMMIPLVAQEAARPWYLYESFYQNGPALPAQTGEQDLQTASIGFGQPSPLLFQPSDFVVLHFQITPDNVVTSPQRPTGKFQDQAMTCCGLTESAVDDNDQKLQEIGQLIDYKVLLYECPSDHLPDARNPEWMMQAGQYTQQQQGQQGQQQLAMQQQEATSQTDSQLPDFSFIEQQLQSQVWQEENEQQSGQVVDNTGPKQQLQQSRNISRGNSEFDKRRRSLDNYAMNQWMANNRLDQQMAAPPVTSASVVREGVMRPVWLDNRLILARRVEREDGPVIQCCWLDWQRIQEALKQEAQDLLPDVRLQPLHNVEDVRLGQALATLPVQLDIDREAMIETLTLDSAGTDEGNLDRSGIRMSLIIAWSGLALAAIAGAFMLHGVLRLSERRGVFVSAVTHELRTPLTTFRMYAEMLAEKMVPPERQQKYAETLKVESERLSHLVENVLQFARLERTGKTSRLESVTLAELLERFGDRLQRRAERASMELVIDIQPEIMKQALKTDPAAIEQILFNLVDNACKYARTADDKTIELSASQNGNRMQVSVRDHGPGVAGADRKRMFLPFRKSDQEAANTEQGVGLGLALCRRMARSLGGSLTMEDGNPGARLILDIPMR